MPLNWLLLASVFVLSALSFWLAYELRFEFDVPYDEASRRMWMLLFAPSCKTVIFYVLGMHLISWRYAGIKDSPIFVLHAIIAAAVIYIASISFPHLRTPRSVILIDGVLTVLFLGGSRVLLRMAREQILGLRRVGKGRSPQRVVIIGAGDAGEMLCREMIRSTVAAFAPVAFFDDNSRKRGVKIHGVPVVGPVDALGAFVARHPVDMAIIAIPSLSRKGFTKLYDSLKPLGIPLKTLPHLTEILRDEPALLQMRDVNLTDLLGREEIKINTGEVRHFIAGKTVLITGAGGSIGSELCRQVLRRGPSKLALVERSENGLFHIHRELAQAGGDVVVQPILCDVTDQEWTRRVFEEHKPDVVFHAAAHKHVPIQELDPTECFRNNVGGAMSAALAADAVGAGHFIMISTDKAVNPSSVMGATKRVCELYCQALAAESRTTFVSVRFGNVLASEGSVVPIFMEQIAKGGPITVTHPDMRRYFMTIPEAVTLVLQAAVLGQSGQVMFLDMGEPVRIVDLVERLLELNGKASSDIPIEYIGLRPGEKLFEELLCTEETCIATAHDKVKICKGSWNGSGNADRARIEECLRKVLIVKDPTFTRAVLKSLVPEYSMQGNGDTGIQGSWKDSPKIEPC
jgi:FlaA1/EpsC-like NDP-sugar epimerase